ncbi:MAG TPA: sigma-70 family RNA polymerase sigma factor [Polyangia bacterium]|jgi:RNA polymerase sigma-70 factor (ECF subfamily)|nr:sigma-70 family RNA polymerase sigma factor [Polyangia bacterium]
MSGAPEQLSPFATGNGAPGHADARRQIDELFKQHSAFVARLVFRLLGRNDEVDDIVQDVFVGLFRGLERMRHPQAMRAWLMTTAVRMVRRRLRVRRIGFLLRRGQRVDPMELSTHAPSTEDAMALRTIHLALGRVSVDARLAWVLRYLEQEEVEEIARVLACSRATAKRRIAEAQAEIKKALHA